MSRQFVFKSLAAAAACAGALVCAPAVAQQKLVTIVTRGVTGLFSFGLAGTGMLGLTETSFLNLLAYDPPGGANEDEQYFIARYQRTGVTGGGSDVAIPSTPPSSVPEPTTLLLTGLGLLGLTGLRRRKA